MTNEYYGVSSTPMDDFLAHYGVRGMKWGVRKAIAKGSDRALRRQRIKAEKKLRKLEKLGANGKKYAKRAALYGAGAAAAGGLAVAGTEGVSRGIKAVGGAVNRASNALSKVGIGKSNSLRTARRLAANGKKTAFGTAAEAVSKWGNKTTAIGESAFNSKYRAGLAKVASDLGRKASDSSVSQSAREVYRAYAKKYNEIANTPRGMTKNTLARIGAGAVGVGLGAAAAKNAYRAATAKKHAAQAKQFRAEMNKTFAGTKYANGVPSKKKKRRSNNA